jgi:hypothetical protein
VRRGRAVVGDQHLHTVRLRAIEKAEHEVTIRFRRRLVVVFVAVEKVLPTNPVDCVEIRLRERAGGLPVEGDQLVPVLRNHDERGVDEPRTVGNFDHEVSHLLPIVDEVKSVAAGETQDTNATSDAVTTSGAFSPQQVRVDSIVRKEYLAAAPEAIAARRRASRILAVQWRCVYPERVG